MIKGTRTKDGLIVEITNTHVRGQKFFYSNDTLKEYDLQGQDPNTYNYWYSNTPSEFLYYEHIPVDKVLDKGE